MKNNLQAGRQVVQQIACWGCRLLTRAVPYRLKNPHSPANIPLSQEN